MKLFEQFLNEEYNVANSGIVVMYNLTPEAIKKLENFGAKVTKEATQGKDDIYDVAFATKEIGEEILNWLQTDGDPIPLPDLRHLYGGLFEKSKSNESMKNFDNFEKSIKINESEISFVNENEETIDLVYVMDGEGHVKNLSKNDEEADTFIRKATMLKGPKKGYKTVYKKDYDNEKVTASNIKNWPEAK